jgi:radical SAM superfamily enzyme YgiQ (UPF0313 family)
MRGNNKLVNVAANYAEVCRRFHEAGIMINGRFVFGFACDRPDVFERTVAFTVENKILTASFHVLTPLPGTRTFARLEAEGRILHRHWARCDTNHAVFRPLRMTPEQLEDVNVDQSPLGNVRTPSSDRLPNINAIHHVVPRRVVENARSNRVRTHRIATVVMIHNAVARLN